MSTSDARPALLDAATLSTTAFRAWSIVGGPLNAALVVALLSPGAQGAYYALGALAKWQTFAELGFGIALQQLASHAAAAPGANERLAGLARLGARWYLGVAALLAVTLPAGGLWWLSGTDLPTGWEAPWLVLAGATAAGIALTPAWVLLEGTGHVAEIYRFRLTQSVAGRVAGWAAMPLFGLWALPVEKVVNAAQGAVWLLTRQRPFFEVLRDTPAAPVHWASTVLPLQWRIALATAGGNVPHALFVPATLAAAGAAEAGELGLALAMIAAVSSVAHGVVQARVPPLSGLAARREWDALDARFGHAVRAAIGVYVAGMTAIVGLAALAALLGVPRADRLPTPAVFATLALAYGVRFVRDQAAVFARLHAREAYWSLELIEGAVALALVPVAARSGAAGIAGGYLAMNVGLSGATAFRLWTFRAERG